MAKLSDGTREIEIKTTETILTTILKASQYRLESLTQYELLLKENYMLTSGKIKTATEEALEIEYDLPQYSKSVSTILKKATLLERIEIARKFGSLDQEETTIMSYFIHPDNLFVVSNQLYVGHRGLTGSIEPKHSDFPQFLKQYKALVINALNPKYTYEEVVTGKVKIKDKTLSKIMTSKTITEIETQLDEQHHALHLTQAETERSVKKSSYGIFKFLTIILTALMIVTGIWLGLLLENTVPRQNRIIEAQAAFMINNFNEATAILSGDDPRSLPPAAQYMLAVSYVELENLRIEQRQSVINNLSPATNEQELRYWIYIGRGNLDGALDIAYSLGATQLKIHAYAHLYDYVYADMEMPGAQKQEYLNNFLNRIETLNEELLTPLEEEEALEDESD